MKSITTLLAEVRSCTLCAAHLPLGPRPVLQLHPNARILVAAQAPGRKVHESGVPFTDASGDRLREWLGLTREVFYDPQRIAIVPMGFCFPGAGQAGDNPPRPECAPGSLQIDWAFPIIGNLHGYLQLFGGYGESMIDYNFRQNKIGLGISAIEWR